MQTNIRIRRAGGGGAGAAAVAGEGARGQVHKMPVSEAIYELGMRTGRALLPRTPFLPEKLRQGIDGRRGLLGRIDAWAHGERGDAPLVWFHAPSVGEGLQTVPVIEALRSLRPDLTVFYTFFSPSAQGLARRLPVDYADYMPFDVAADVSAVIDVVRPQAIVFGKADVWPNCARLAAERGVRLALVSATLSPSSSRRGWWARSFLSGAYRRLDAVGAISEDDAVLLSELGVPAKRIQVTGDARFDQVKARADGIDRSAAPLAVLAAHDGATLVAGSTWPEGEGHLIQALARLGEGHARLRSIIAPHEPTPVHLEDLEARLAAEGLSSVRLSELERAAERPAVVVIVDRVGVLAEIYALADIAYVGGGFGLKRGGLHSVLEPAALGVPVLYGPRHANAREAAQLIERGGAREVAGAGDLEQALRDWLANREARQAAGAAAAAFIEENLGAGRRNAELVLGLLGVD